MSLGSAVGLLASPLEIDALVIESVYPSVNDAIHNRVAIKLGPLSTIPAELLLAQLKPRLNIWPSKLRPIDHLPNVDCPVYMISGVKDRHTTARETKQMLFATRQPKELWLVDGAAHVDVYHVSSLEDKDRVVGVLDKFMHR